MANVCPNCGAPYGSAPLCEYCGTLKDQAVYIDPGSPVDILFEKDGYQYHFKGVVTSYDLNAYVDTDAIYNDYGYYKTIVSSPPRMTLNIGMDIFKTEDGASCTVRKK